MDINHLINEALRREAAAQDPKVRVFQGASLAALIKEIASKTECDYGPDCPIHRKPLDEPDDDQLLTDEDTDRMIEGMDEDAAYRGAVASIASSHNALVRKDYEAANAEQEQARLYFQLRDVCMQREFQAAYEKANPEAPVEKPAEDAGSRNEDEPVS